MIRPIGQNIIVQKDPKKPTSEGGILIPECAERTPRFSPTVCGTVLGVGGKVKELRAGDRIALKSHAGDDWFIADQTLTILRERDIVGFAR